MAENKATKSHEKNKGIEEPLQEEPADKGRRDFMVMTATGVAAVGAIAAATPFVQSLGPSKDVLAVGSVEVDISAIAEGQTHTVMWRGKPVFVRHRTAKEIEDAEGVDLAKLPDPEEDSQRVMREKWLITIGVCTHLGCVPQSGKGDYGGWLCPCHGSHYDTSGRIRRGPAPSNLPIPEYSFLDENTVKIG